LKACEGNTIKDFFQQVVCFSIYLGSLPDISFSHVQVGLKKAFDYAAEIEKEQKRDVPGDRYENLRHVQLF
jgi:hypothetical protein